MKTSLFRCLTNLLLLANSLSYSIYLVGTPGSLAGVVTPDK